MLVGRERWIGLFAFAYCWVLVVASLAAYGFTASARGVPSTCSVHPLPCSLTGLGTILTSTLGQQMLVLLSFTALLVLVCFPTAGSSPFGLPPVIGVAVLWFLRGVHLPALASSRGRTHRTGPLAARQDEQEFGGCGRAVAVALAEPAVPDAGNPEAGADTEGSTGSWPIGATVPFSGMGKETNLGGMEFLIVVVVLVAAGGAFLWARKHFAKEIGRAKSIPQGEPRRK